MICVKLLAARSSLRFSTTSLSVTGSSAALTAVLCATGAGARSSAA